MNRDMIVVSTNIVIGAAIAGYFISDFTMAICTGLMFLGQVASDSSRGTDEKAHSWYYRAEPGWKR